MDGLTEAKARMRREAAARRAEAHAAGSGAGEAAAHHLLALLGAWTGRDPGGPVSGFLPIRSEIDPRPAMAALARQGRPLALPVIEGRGLPLRFRAWTPETPLAEGSFRTLEPASGDFLVPGLLLVPLLAFDARGCRLGYGGGFYDRTLAALRARGPVLALGLAYAAQEVAEVPAGPADMRLDGVVTEAGPRIPAGPAALAPPPPPG